MLKINYNCDITMTKGDSYELIFKFDRDLKTTENVYFSVKKRLNDTSYAISKSSARMTGSVNKAKFSFSPSDTDIESGDYWYDIRVADETAGEQTGVQTPFTPRRLRIEETVKTF